MSKLLVDIGTACSEFQDRTIRNLTSTRIECDEIWAFCYSKAKNVPEDHTDELGYGDIWTWTAIDPDTKLIPSWLVGWRGEMEAVAFLTDLRGRLANRIQLTTDGHIAYRGAVEYVFGSDIDYAQLIKQYARTAETPRRSIRRASTRRTRSPAKRSASTVATLTRR